MVNKTFLIHNKSGLHVRPAGVLVKVIQQFECDVVMRFNGREYNAKSILGIMSAGIKSNENVEFECSGSDEAMCISAIQDIISAGLGEGE